MQSTSLNELLWKNKTKQKKGKKTTTRKHFNTAKTTPICLNKQMKYKHFLVKMRSWKKWSCNQKSQIFILFFLPSNHQLTYVQVLRGQHKERLQQYFTTDSWFCILWHWSDQIGYLLGLVRFRSCCCGNNDENEYQEMIMITVPIRATLERDNSFPSSKPWKFPL